MVIGFLAIAGVIMTGMSSIIGNLDAQRGRFYSRIDAIRIHMVQYSICKARFGPVVLKDDILTIFSLFFVLKRYMELPQEIQTWVYRYYYYLWIHHKGNAFDDLFDDLPYALHSEISTARYKPLLKKVSVFF